jgi:hypothetical protein
MLSTTRAPALLQRGWCWFTLLLLFVSGFRFFSFRRAKGDQRRDPAVAIFFTLVTHQHFVGHSLVLRPLFS